MQKKWGPIPSCFLSMEPTGQDIQKWGTLLEILTEQNISIESRGSSRYPPEQSVHPHARRESIFVDNVCDIYALTAHDAGMIVQFLLQTEPMRSCYYASIM